MAKDKDEVKIPRGRDISSLSDALNKYMKSDISVPGDHVSSISESTHLYPTSILSLDKYLGVGGVLGGRIMNIWGWEGSGKTLTALTVAAGLQRLKIPESAANPEGVPRVAFMDAEGTFSPTLAASIGVDCSKLLVIKSTPERIISGEDYFHLAGILIQNGIEMIIIDSVPALVPSARLTAVAAQGQKAAQAQMLSEGLAQLNTFLNAFQRSSVWMINQVRAKPMVMFGSPEDHTGGNALKFYSTYSLEVKKFDSDGDIKKSVPKQHGTGYEDRKIGVKIRATLHKNKTAPIPEKSIEYEVYFENVTDKEGYTYQAGVDIYKDVFQTALLSGIITQNSSWYSYGDIKANGETGFIQELRKADASVLTKIRNEVLSKGSAV